MRARSPYQTRFVQAAREHRAADEPCHAVLLDADEATFSTWVAQLAAEPRGVGLPAGFVTCATY